MSIPERLERDMVAAAKARDSVRLGVIRYLRSELKNRAIELGDELSEDDCVGVLSRVAKGHREAIEQAEAQNRAEIVGREKSQLAIVEEYLPEALSPGELEALVDEVIEEVSASGPRDMGLVMKTIMPRVKGRAEGGAVKEIVGARLSSRREAEER